MSGYRSNSGKLRLSLISPWAQEGLARVLTFGAQKYAAHNWAKGLSFSETIDSLERHLAALKRGEDIDPESKLPHVDHIQCNAMFLSHYMALPEYRAFDDRWKRGGGRTRQAKDTRRRKRAHRVRRGRSASR